MIEIIPFEEKYYPDIVRITNELYPFWKTDVRETKYYDKIRNKKLLFERYIILLKNEVIGDCRICNMQWYYHPQKFHLDIGITKKYQNKGYGTKVMDFLLSRLDELGWIRIMTSTNEKNLLAIHFLKKYGFKEKTRDWRSILNVKEVDMQKASLAYKQVEKLGIELVTLAEETDSKKPILRPEIIGTEKDKYKKLHKLDSLTSRDMPQIDKFTETPFDDFMKSYIYNPNFREEAFFIAKHEDNYVGYTALCFPPDSDPETEMTGVLRKYRRKGIATALKYKSIEYTQKQGIEHIRTFNDTTNIGMLSINEKLGFKKLPAWIEFVKDKNKN